MSRNSFDALDQLDVDEARYDIFRIHMLEGSGHLTWSGSTAQT